jgi:squalene-hopene/tetraprenyl-beta-curcumene cyclase
MTRNTLYATAIVAGLAVSTAAAEPILQADDQVRAVVEQALPFIQREGADWIEQRNCVSCHQVPFMIWSLNRAADHGLDVDKDQLERWSDWSTDWRHFSPAEADEEDAEAAEKALASNGDVLYQLLLGRGGTDGDAPPWIELFLTSLAQTQQQDGSWKAGGQLPSQKRAKSETTDVSTMWTLLTLVSNRPAEIWRPRLEAAAPILKRTKQPVSAEWFAVRLLLEEELGRTEAADEILQQLLAHQRPDGGWGWLLDEESDALATGIVLYALGRRGLRGTDPNVAKAQQFLLGAQSKDGSWPVRGTKAAKRDSVEETSTYWGTCWAVIGLLETIGS